MKLNLFVNLWFLRDFGYPSFSRSFKIRRPFINLFIFRRRPFSPDTYFSVYCQKKLNFQLDLCTSSGSGKKPLFSVQQNVWPLAFFIHFNEFQFHFNAFQEIYISRKWDTFEMGTEKISIKWIKLSNIQTPKTRMDIVFTFTSNHHNNKKILFSNIRTTI